MSAIKGDFTGFTFNGIHSSELGITRVSDGSRYTEELLPAIQDKTVQIPGADGTYYYGSSYTQRPFNISVVFDDMTETQFVRLKKVFGDKGIHDLIFDEWPYKVYRVKSTGTPNLKYICFDKGIDQNDRDYDNDSQIKSKEDLYGVSARSTNGRVYKGEGQINLITYAPFARSRYKYIDQYNFFNVPEWGSMDTAAADSVHYNLYDWVDSVGFRTSNVGKSYNNTTYQIDKVTNSGVMIYNPGDLPTNFTLTIVPKGTFNGLRVDLGDSCLILNGFSLEGSDKAFRINGKLNLIEGLIEDNSSYYYIQYTPTSNPKEEGLYEYNFTTQNYETTNDTTIGSKTYYKQMVGKYEPSGIIYNKNITQGDFFKLPITSDLEFMSFSPAISGGTASVLDENSRIEYNYLFY